MQTPLAPLPPFRADPDAPSDAEEKELKAYVDTAASATLLDAVPAGGTIARTSAKDAIGITEWELSYGV